MKVNSPSQKTTSADKVKSAMRSAGIGFMEVDDYIVIKRKGHLVSFNPMTNDDDAILLAKMAGLSIKGVGISTRGVADIGFVFNYEPDLKLDRIDVDLIKSLKVDERFFIRKRIVCLISEFGVNKSSG